MGNLEFEGHQIVKPEISPKFHIQNSPNPPREGGVKHLFWPIKCQKMAVLIENLDFTCPAAKQQRLGFRPKKLVGCSPSKRIRVLVHFKKMEDRLGCSFPNQLYETILDWKTFGFIMFYSVQYTFAKHWEDIFSKPNLFQIKYVQHFIPMIPSFIHHTQNSPPPPVSPVRAGCSESTLRQSPLATRGASPSRRRRRCFQAPAERTGGRGPTRGGRLRPRGRRG